MGYTWRQFTAYRERAARRRTAALREQLQLMLASASAGRASKLLQALSGAPGAPGSEG